jgi:hypothetical protein
MDPGRWSLEKEDGKGKGTRKRKRDTEKEKEKEQEKGESCDSAETMGVNEGPHRKMAG